MQMKNDPINIFPIVYLVLTYIQYFLNDVEETQVDILNYCVKNSDFVKKKIYEKKN